MKRRSFLALCMLSTAALFLQAKALHAGGLPVGQGTWALERYSNDAIQRGAPRLALPARVLYREGVRLLEKGRKKEAYELLERATRLDPSFPDPHFTLAKLQILSLDLDGFVHAASGISAVLDDFRYQSLAAASGLAGVIMLLLFLAAILAAAFAVKYLPFGAHRLREYMERRLKASRPLACAYLLLLVPFALFPGVITAFALIVVLTWVFMSRSERVVVLFVTGLIAAAGFSSSFLGRITPATDPRSLSTLLYEANYSGADPRAIAMLDGIDAETGDLRYARDFALGLLYLRGDELLGAADHFLACISRDPANPKAYVNLGNVYFLVGEYDKALEGYIKAEALDTLDAVCQYDLAQAYIKTLLLGKSSVALAKASRTGIERVRNRYTPDALERIKVFPATFSPKELWRYTLEEGSIKEGNYLAQFFLPITGFEPKAAAWMVLVATIIAMLIGARVDRSRLAFQCANCGELTCAACSCEHRGSLLCSDCGAAIEEVSSEKVVEALLRQRRQSMLVKKRKRARLIGYWLPGLRALVNGDLGRGLVLSSLFGAAVILLRYRGLIIEDWRMIELPEPVWKIFVPGAMIFIGYAKSVFFKYQVRFRVYQSPSSQNAAGTPDDSSSAETALFHRSP